MRYRRLGSTDLECSVIGLGCSRIGSLSGGVGGSAACRLLREAFDQGINVFDTADIYGQGDSERALGELSASCKQRVIIMTKGGYRFGPIGSSRVRVKALMRSVVRMLPGSKQLISRARASVARQDFSKAYLTGAIEGSLRRLRRDFLDVFLLHSPNRGTIESEEPFDLLESFKAAGKIRYYGVSCQTVEDALACLNRPTISVLQVRMNPIDRRSIDQVLPRTREVSIAVVAREVFANGSLFTVRPAKPYSLACATSFDTQAMRIPQSSGDQGMARGAVRFVLRQEGVSLALVGTTNLLHLRESIAEIEAPSLNPVKAPVLRFAP